MVNKRYLETKCAIENIKNAEMGVNNTDYVDCVIDLEIVKLFRKEYDDNGHLTQTGLYDEYGEYLLRIALDYDNFKKLYFEYKNNDLNIFNKG